MVARVQFRPGGIWVEFVVGSRFALRVFIGVLRLSLLYKNQHSKFQFDQDRGSTWKPAKADVFLSLKDVRAKIF